MAKIMLVEDDNNLREIYGARLQAEGHEIVAAKDGEEALAMAIKEKPDLVISDVMMPRISGFDMLDILRNAPETKNTKVIMMTALSQAEDKARADKLGADRYLVKSQVTLEDVAKVVREVLGLEDGEDRIDTSASIATPVAPPVAPDPPTPTSAAMPPPNPEPPAAPPTTLPPAPVTSPAPPPASSPIVMTSAPDEPTSTSPASSPSPSSTVPAPDDATKSDDAAAAGSTAPTTAPLVTSPPTENTDTSSSVNDDVAKVTATSDDQSEDQKKTPLTTNEVTATDTVPVPPPAVTPLTTPELAAAQELLQPPSEKPDVTPPSEPAPSPSTSVSAAIPSPPLSSTPPPPTPPAEEQEQFIGPSLEQALAAEESLGNSQNRTSDPMLSSTPTIINGVDQSGIISPAASTTAPDDESTKNEESTPEPPPSPPPAPEKPTPPQLPPSPPTVITLPGDNEPNVIKPTAPQPAPAAAAKPSPTPPPASNLLDDDNLHKKVIKPIHDPRAKPDFNALLAKEEEKAAIINPVAGSNIKPVISGPPPTPPADQPPTSTDVTI